MMLMFVMTLLDSSREVRSSSLNVIPARRKHAHHPRSGIHPTAFLFLRNSLRWKKWRSNRFDKRNVRVPRKRGSRATSHTRNLRDWIAVSSFFVVADSCTGSASDGGNVTTFVSRESHEERRRATSADVRRRPPGSIFARKLSAYARKLLQ